MTLKENLLKLCQQFLDQRMETIQYTISEIQKALESETKSSAGDKHETGRAMLQLEREKAGQQLAELQKSRDIINRVNPNTNRDTAALGSIVYTTRSNYFIAVSAGELEVENEKYYAISPATPIAQLLFSKSANDSVEFRDLHFEITKII